MTHCNCKGWYAFFYDKETKKGSYRYYHNDDCKVIGKEQ